MDVVSGVCNCPLWDTTHKDCKMATCMCSCHEKPSHFGCYACDFKTTDWRYLRGHLGTQHQQDTKPRRIEIMLKKGA